MHELSIALSIIEGVEEELEKHNGSRVSTVFLRVGPLSGVVKEALLFSYDAACAGTRLEGSKLTIEEEAVVLFCPTCNAERSAESSGAMACAVCGTPSHDIRQGDALEVVAIELCD